MYMTHVYILYSLLSTRTHSTLLDNYYVLANIPTDCLSVSINAQLLYSLLSLLTLLYTTLYSLYRLKPAAWPVLLGGAPVPLLPTVVESLASIGLAHDHHGSHPSSISSHTAVHVHVHVHVPVHR